MAIVGLKSGYSNVVAASVQSAANIPPPVLKIVQTSVAQGLQFMVSWNGMGTHAVVIECASDPRFMTIVATNSGLGNMVNGKQGLTFKLPKGTYWFRGYWQSANITQKGKSG